MRFRPYHVLVALIIQILPRLTILIFVFLNFVLSFNNTWGDMVFLVREDSVPALVALSDRWEPSLLREEVLSSFQNSRPLFFVTWIREEGCHNHFC